MSGRIVVGVDGSSESMAALAWAIREARLRDAELTVVTAWQVPRAGYTGIPGAAFPDDITENLQRGAEALQTKVLEEVSDETAGLELRTVVREGSAAPVLLTEAEGADLLVVGSRGLGGFRELVLGSVSQQCAHHSTCPVVIVRHTDTDSSNST